MKKIWECKIGEVDDALLPDGADFPMRRAIERAYQEMTGREPNFIFSGWGAKLTSTEQAIARPTDADPAGKEGA